MTEIEQLWAEIALQRVELDLCHGRLVSQQVEIERLRGEKYERDLEKDLRVATDTIMQLQAEIDRLQADNGELSHARQRYIAELEWRDAKIEQLQSLVTRKAWLKHHKKLGALDQEESDG